MGHFLICKLVRFDLSMTGKTVKFPLYKNYSAMLMFQREIFVLVLSLIWKELFRYSFTVPSVPGIAS